MIRPPSILNRQTTIRCAGVLLALVCAGLLWPTSLHLARAEEPDPSATKPAEQNYGRTPDRVVPYRNFREPYARFYRKPQLFRGTGRSTTDAEMPDTVRIGLLAPVGAAPDADLGREMIDAAILAIDQANAAGGYKGISFEAIVRQDTGLWGGTAKETVGFMFQDDVLAVLGSIDGANTHVALRVALKVQLPMLNTGATDPTLTETAIPWLMRCMADDRQQGYALAHHIFGELGIEKVAAFRVNDRYGRTGIAEFRDAARRLKHPLRVELRWERGDRKFDEQLDRIALTGAQAVVLWGNASDTAAVVREIRRRNMPQRVFGCDRLVSRRFLDEAGDAAAGVVAVATFNPTEPNAQYAAFSLAFQERFDREPGTFAAHAFDGANILIEAIRKGGLNRVLVRDALHEYREYDGVTGRIEFDTTLNDIGQVYIASVNEGEWVYKPAEFAKTAKAAPRPRPYRTILDSTPVVRLAQGATGSRGQGAPRIGCFLPLDDLGRSAVRGVEMALAEDADRHPGSTPIELVVRDSRGTWGDNSNALTSLVVDETVVALIGSTERRGTHLIETLAVKLHVPLITLCGDDPTIHAIPMPWVFSVAPAGERPRDDFVARYDARFGERPMKEAAMGYDAGCLLINAIRAGEATRTTVRQALTTSRCHQCASGSFEFDVLGRRVERDVPVRQAASEGSAGVKVTTRQTNRGREARKYPH